MYVPAPPPVELANLGNLASDRSKKRALARRHPIAMAILGALSTAGTAGAAGTLAWRLAPVLGPALPRLLAPLRDLRRGRRRSRRNLWIGAGAGLAVLGLLGWQLQRLFTAKPKHEVERRVGHLEIRRYPSIRIAETTVEGTWDAALDEGFRRLAAFIS
ncbi:MAG: uncharacterized protein K0S65_675, partial [Labilithrix sp.]|nr:uncharacterized protein [Labilithrix sp.]